MEDRKDKLISALMEYLYGLTSPMQAGKIFVKIIGMTSEEIDKYGFSEVLYEGED